MNSGDKAHSVRRLRDTLFRGERDIDDEDATFAGHIAGTDLAAVRPYGFPSYRKSKAEARSIAATSIAELLKQIALARRNPTALVLGLDEQSAVFGAGAQDHAAAWRGVLEAVVQQVHHGGREELRVRVDRQSWVNSVDRKLNLAVLRVQHPGRSDLVDERGDTQASMSLFASVEADFGQRAVR